MILVQKPPTLTPSQFPLYAHRRHPSAPPAVVVLPTRTPGLLTVSSPPRPRQQRQNHQNQIPKPLPKSRSTQVVRPPLLNSPAEIKDNKKPGVIALPTTPPPQPRGRGQIKQTKDRVQNQRSPSYPAVHGKRQPPSPIPQPQLKQISSQAEVTVTSTNFFDPFLDDEFSVSSNPPSPTLPSRKSTKHKPSPSLVRSEAIPVPVATRRQMFNISRSDPLPSQTRQRPRPILALPSASQHFPICDDLNDEVDSGLPTTPCRHHDNGLQTAPIFSRTPGAFPFNVMSLPSPLSIGASQRRNRNRKHRRTPSEGVFHMSSDEDLSSGPGGSILNPNVQALFGLVNTTPSSMILPPAFSTPIRAIPPFKRDSTPPSNGSLSKEKQLEREVAEKAAGYFASSMFQNSPSPEELPDPLLF